MGLNSVIFLIFVILSVLIYYMIPKKFQWGWLLIVSYIYYLSNAGWALVFIVTTTVTTWYAGLMLEREQSDSRRRMITAVTLLLNFGILAVLKYTNFAVSNISSLFHLNLPTFKWVLPLGISFYTFQSMGYLLDVCWKRQQAEKNLLHFALFVSFFPQIMQGPIGRYERLAHQFFEEHRFDIRNMERGMQLIFWGLFKKMVLADTAAYYVNAIFDDPERYPGLSIFAILAYSIHLYGDFSGGIDVISGIAVLFGIELDKNFRQPYFAVNLTDFWHRWHITLGSWMKDYVFYPISLSGWMGSFGKWCRKKFGRKTGRTIPIAIANVMVFLIVGVWHGAAWQYIAYGLYNGLIIGVSGLLVQQFRDWKKKLHIRDDSTRWHVFCVLRTFFIVNISWFFDRALSRKMAFVMMKNAVTCFTPAEILTITVGQSGSVFSTPVAIGVLLVGCMIVFAVSMLCEKGVNVAEEIMRRPFAFRLALYAIMLILPAVLGQPPLSEGGFIYAQF